MTPIALWSGPRDGAAIQTIAHVPTPRGHLRLVGLDADGRHYVADQAADNRITLLVGPITATEALEAALRVLAGTERSVSDGALVMAGALAICAAVAEMGDSR